MVIVATAIVPAALDACSLPIVKASARSSGHEGGSLLGSSGSRIALYVPSLRFTATIADYWVDYVLMIAAGMLTHSSTLSQRLASLPGRHPGT